MSRKTSPTRRAAFLAALRETGNQTLAAERAKVSRSWVQLHRSTDPEFDAAVQDACLDFARHEREGTKPPSGWGSLDGEELVVRGTNGVRVQIARARLRQWTPRAEERFLRTLSATCNVKAACAEVGLTPASAYKHRERWAGFARRWDAAVADGCVTLEAALLEAAGNALSPVEIAPAGPADPSAPAIEGMDAHQALHLLYMHKHYQLRPGRWPGRPPSRVTEGELAAKLERELAKLDRRGRGGRRRR